jgi:hypothetical protein
MEAMQRWSMVAAVVFIVGCGSSDDNMGDPDAGVVASCDSDVLAALASASSGDTVTIEDCSVTGPLTVGAGVTLQGSGAAVVIAPANGVAVELVPGTQAARLVTVNVRSGGRAGIVVRGAGAASIEQVNVLATLGIGIGAEDTTALSLTDVTITGPVTSDNASTVSMIPDPDEDPGYEPWLETASHGLVLVRTADTTLSNVTTTGFGFYGAAFVASTGTTWSGGSASDNLRTGVQVYGGSATLTNLVISETLRGGLTKAAVQALELLGGAVVTTSALTVENGEGAGIVHDSVQADHTMLVVTGNGWTGVHVQNNTAPFHIDGTTISNNAVAGVVFRTASNVLVENATIDDNIKSTVGGDGVAVREVTAPFVLRNLSLSNNSRVQIVFDQADNGARLDSSWLQNIAVNGTGSQNGAILQNALAADDWDSGVTRDSVTANNDANTSAGACGPPDTELVDTKCGDVPILGVFLPPFMAIAPNNLIDTGLDSILGLAN